MVSTARVQVDRFRTVDEVEWQTVQADSAPRTVAAIEGEILAINLQVGILESTIRDEQVIIANMKAGGRSPCFWSAAGHQVRLDALTKTLAGLKAEVAALNAEVEAIETRVPAHVLRAAE